MEVVQSKASHFHFLRKKLVDTEFDPDAQEQLFQSLRREGVIMIATVEMFFRDHVQHLQALGHLRSLFATMVWSADVSLVKADETKFFVYSESPSAMLCAAYEMVKLASIFPAWLSSAAPELSKAEGLETLQMRIGMECGSVLLLTGDCYGDPVNVASKLGEDIAEPGQVCIGSVAAKMLREDPASAELLARLKPTEATTEISRVELTYLVGRIDAVGERASGRAMLPDQEGVFSPFTLAGLGASPERKTAAVLVTDMSGFTSLTKKYGILHYIRLILRTRDIFKPLIAEFGGTLVKYDGDNIIATFPTCHAALLCTKKAWAQISAYNASREKDFQCRVGCALCYGEVTQCGSEVLGVTFDRAFLLAEEVSEAQEILVTQHFKDQLPAGDTLLSDCVISPERTAKHKTLGDVSHRSLTFGGS